LTSKEPVAGARPAEGKRPRTTSDIKNLKNRLFKWRVSYDYIELDHAKWGWGSVDIRLFFDILTGRLHELESMAWSEVDKRKHCHPWRIDNLDSEARKAVEKHCPDRDLLYQIDISKLGRIIGYRDREVFYLMFYDPNHEWYKTKR
jgi:hypothetical protein